MALFVIGCSCNQLEHISDCVCFVTGERQTKCAGVQTDSGIVLPKSSCHTYIQLKFDNALLTE